MEHLQKTENLTLCCIESRVEDNRSFYGRFQLGPFDVGQGLTIANAIRRTLLSELQGLAIVAVEIEGAYHEYSTLPGIRESVLDILLNLKQIVLTSNFKIQEPQFGYLQVKGPGKVKASDLKLPLSIQCVDPNQYIADLSYDASLNIKFFICQGKNYLSFSNVSSEFQRATFTKTNDQQLNKNFNLLMIDAVFMPVNKVNYIVENYTSSRLGKQKEKVIFEIWTNGSIHPRQAIHEASKILVRLFSPFQETRTLKSIFFKPLQIPSSKRDTIKKITSLDIGNLDLSLRPYTCLKRAKINTIGDLLQYSPEELLLLKNFGKRSLEEVQLLLKQIGFKLRIGNQIDKKPTYQN
jgi:DNA-directed RNA polymerase subunit alpha